jgi:NADPH2:quinone reductase
MSRAVRISRSTVIDAPIDAIWRLLRDFNSHESWHPAIATSRIEAGEPADSVGAVRVFQLGDGSTLREQLIALSDRERQLTYCLLEAPLPLMDYVATMRLRPVTEGDRTFMTWESRFRPPEDRAEELSRLVAGDIYEAGFRALKARFENRPAERVGRSAGSTTGFPVEHTSLPHAEVPAEGAPRSTQGASPAHWTVLRGGSDFVGTAPQDEVVGVAAFGSSTPRLAERHAVTSPAAIEARGIVVPRYGGAEVMEERVLSVPPPGPGEVRLRHTAIGVNFIDIYCRTGFFSLLTPPGVPGMEAAGVVTDVGEGVTHLQTGDRVVYACEPVGAYAEARTISATLLVPLPEDIDDETAAAIFLKGLSAEFLLHRVHAVQPGEIVLVHAAAGGVGLLLCEWARAIGADVIGTVSTEEKAEHALRAGCAEVIVHARENFVDAVKRLTAGRGVDVVYDGVGQATFAGSVEVLAERGHLISFGQASGPVGSWDIGALASKSATISRPNFGHYTSDPRLLHGMSERVFDALRRGIIRPTIDARLPLAQAAEAHRRLEDRKNIGAIVLIP